MYITWGGIVFKVTLGVEFGSRQQQKQNERVRERTRGQLLKLAEVHVGRVGL